ncbi:MAG: degQ [Acidimicrobiales bacterium]|nr:degQ [Acidimicrobiales bacterium]
MDTESRPGQWPTGAGTSPPMASGPWVPPGSSAPPPRPPVYPPYGPQQPPGQPTHGGPLPTLGGPQPAPPAPPSRPARAWLGLAAVTILAVVAALGYGFGRWVDNTSRTTVYAPVPAATTPVTQAAPLTGREAEPVAAIANAVGPSVVQINTDAGLGSGFIYKNDASGSLILTASHVVTGASSVQVRLADGTKLSGKVVGSDPATDVAVVRVSAGHDLPAAVLATGVKPRVGQIAVAIGSPFGLQQTVTAGIVSAVGRSSETPGGVIPAIQTDAPINPGNSGGALANAKGEIFGINDSIATASGSAQSGNVGVGFAIPIDLAKPVADKLVAGISPTSGYLGVRGADPTGLQSGAVITTVEPGSPAQQSGLRPDDVVTAVDGTQVQGMIDLVATVRTHGPGETVTVTFTRGGKALTAQVKLVAPPGH